MGKASRRKAGGIEGKSAQEIIRAMASNDPRFNTGFGGQLLVKNFDGAILTGEAARDAYWATVGEAIRGDDPSQLPAMMKLGQLMGLSIYDVEIPVMDVAGAGGQTMEQILRALILIEYPRCFEWLIARLGAPGLPDERLRLAKVVPELAISADSFEEGSPRLRMAKIAVRATVEFFEEHGSSRIEEVPGFASSEVFKSVLSDFRAEKLAGAELDELREAVDGAESIQPSTGARRV